MLGRARPDQPTSAESGRSVEDVDIDSLLALVAETMGEPYSFADDGASMRLGGRTINLVGLRREAGRRSREDWPVLVSEHLSRRDEPFDACNLNPIKALLRIRVHAADDPDIPDPSRIIGRHLSADLIEVLTVGARPIRPEEAFCWPIPPAEALDLALANGLADERPAVTESDLGGVLVRSLAAPSATAHLRELPCPADGMLVVLPRPDVVTVHPVEGISVVRALERMRVHAQREYDADPGGLSPHVYWLHQGRLIRIQADLVAQDGQIRLVVTPPPEFARLLARIAATAN
ncbi:hypothetical protein J5X84_21695 [Streptosporangiaceae bacterium NEAU-GS5]|nr:hypothetical protein [Streptosporangiaceae bacterium NEAU-GS5]